MNGVNGRLAVLLRWLEEAEPDIVVLQELKAPQDIVYPNIIAATDGRSGAEA